MSEIKPELKDSDAKHCQVTWEKLYVCYAIGEASTANIEKLCRNLDMFARQQRGIAFVLATRDTTRPPSEESRRLVRQVFTRNRDNIACVAICVEAVGFSSAIIRAVTSALFVLSQPGLKVRFFSSMNESVPWVAESVGMATQDVRSVYYYCREIVGQ